MYALSVSGATIFKPRLVSIISDCNTDMVDQEKPLSIAQQNFALFEALEAGRQCLLTDSESNTRELDQADCTNAFTIIQKLSHSDNISEKQNAVRHILKALQSIENDEGATKELFRIIERLALEDEPIIQTEVLEQFPLLMIHCIQSATLYSLNHDILVPMLLYFLDNDNSQVRKTCQNSVMIALEQGLFSNDEIVCGFLPNLLRLSQQQNNSDDVRVEAVTLLCKLVPSLGREKTIELFLNHFTKLCADPLFHIRKVCASNLGDISKVVGPKSAEKIVIPHLIALSQDNIWGVRKCCAECFPLMSNLCTMETRRHHLAPVFIALLSDTSRWVQIAAFQSLGQFISTFADNNHDCQWSEDQCINDSRAVPADKNHAMKTVAFDDLCSIGCQSSMQHQMLQRLNFLKSASGASIAGSSANNAAIKSSGKSRWIPPGDIRDNDQEQNYVFDPCIAQLMSLSIPAEQIAFDSDIDLSNNRSENHIDVQNRSESQTESVAASLTPPLQLLCSSDNMIIQCSPPTNADGFSVEDVEGSSPSPPHIADALLLPQPDANERPSRPTFIKFDSEEADEWSFASFKFWRAPTPQLNDVATDDVTKSSVDDAGLQSFMERHMPFATLTSPTDELLAVDSPNATNDLFAPPLNRVVPFWVAEGDAHKAMKALDEFFACMGNDNFEEDKTKVEDDFTIQASREKEAEATGVSHSSHRMSSTAFSRLSVDVSLPGPENEDNFGNDSNQNAVKFDKQESHTSMCNDRSFNTTDLRLGCSPKSAPGFSVKSLPVKAQWDISFHDDEDYEEEIDRNLLAASFSKSSEVKDLPKDFEYQDIIPQELLDEFLSMVQPVRAQNIESDISRHCAFNFPAVASTLGAKNWPLIRSTYLTLANDLTWKVRRTLAFSIHELAANLGTDITTKDLLPVFTGFLRDLDEVRIGVLKNLANFLKLLDKNDRATLLCHLADFLQTENYRNWRFRYLFAEQLILLCDLFDIKAINDYLSPIAMTLAIDKVSEIRLITHKLMAVIVTHFYREETRANGDNGPTFITDSFMEDIIKGFAKSQRWIRRQTFVCVCQEIARLNALPPRKFVADLSSTLCAMIEDRVPNVRLSLAKLLSRLDETYLEGAATDGDEKDRSAAECLRQARLVLTNDRDRDVRQAASPASTTMTSSVTSPMPTSSIANDRQRSDGDVEATLFYDLNFPPLTRDVAGDAAAAGTKSSSTSLNVKTTNDASATRIDIEIGQEQDEY